MIKKDSNSGISKSLSLSSLSIQQTDDNFILTSTKGNEKSSAIIANSNRRKRILPTPNAPKNEQNLFRMDNNKESSCINNFNASTYSKQNSHVESSFTVDNFD